MPELVWQELKNKKQLEPGTQVRIVDLDLTASDDEISKRVERYKVCLGNSKNKAIDIVAQNDICRWKYGEVSQSGLVINDLGGVSMGIGYEINRISTRFIEAKLPKRKKSKWMTIWKDGKMMLVQK